MVSCTNRILTQCKRELISLSSFLLVVKGRLLYCLELLPFVLGCNIRGVNWVLSRVCSVQFPQTCPSLVLVNHPHRLKCRCPDAWRRIPWQPLMAFILTICSNRNQCIILKSSLALIQLVTTQLTPFYASTARGDSGRMLLKPSFMSKNAVSTILLLDKEYCMFSFSIKCAVSADFLR